MRTNLGIYFECYTEYLFATVFDAVPHRIEIHLSKSLGSQKIFSVIEKVMDTDYRINEERLARNKKREIIFNMSFNINHIIIYTEKWGILTIKYDKDKVESHATMEKIIKAITPYLPKPRPKPKSGKVYILTMKQSKAMPIQFKKFSLPPMKINIPDNYTKDFQPKHKKISERLNKKNDNGIVILHGSPGTGKTYYLRYISKITKKRVLYIPPALVGYVTEPYFIALLGKYRNSVLAIEDADNVMRSRDRASDMQEVSSLLNITDGILHDVLKLQVVVTFNTEMRNIDDAFLRQGRLIAEHKFKPLLPAQASKLSQKLGHKVKYDKPATLAEIYNVESAPKEMRTNGIGYRQ